MIQDFLCWASYVWRPSHTQEIGQVKESNWEDEVLRDQRVGNTEHLHTARALRQVVRDGSQGMLCQLRKHSNTVGLLRSTEFFTVPVGAMQRLSESVLGVLQNSFLSLGQFNHPLDRAGALKSPQQHGVYLSAWLPKGNRGPAASSVPGNLLNIQMLWPHPALR